MEVKKMNKHTVNGIFPGILLKAGEEITNHEMYEQVSSRPAIDDVVCHKLDGSALKNALFIIDNIRENKMKIKWSSVNVWSVRYKRRHVCDLRIERGSLVIGQVSEILATRVRNLPYNPKSLNPLLDALRDFTTNTQEATYAMS